MAPPALAPKAARYSGTSLTGPRTTDAAAFLIEESTSIVVRARIRWFESTPTHTMPALEDRIERIVDRENASELLVAPGLTEAAWVESGEKARLAFEALALAERSVEVSSVESLLPPGVTMSVDSEALATRQPIEGAWHTAFEVSHLSLPDAAASGNALRVSLVFSGYVPSASAVTPDLLVRRNEVIVLRDAPVVDGDAFALLFEPRGIDDGGAFLVFVDAVSALAPGAETTAVEEIMRELAACGAECAVAGAVAAVGPSPDPLTGIVTLERDHRRGALARLAILNGARVTADLAAAADDDTIDGFVAKLAESRKDAPPASDIGLELEKASWKYLADRMSGTDFPSALAAVALDHAGEAGRFAAVIEDVSASARSIAEIEQRLVAQNRSLLEDRSPSTRVRAFEWLTKRALAPEAYDPLADLKARKKALRAAEDKEAEAAMRGVGGGA